MPAFSVGEMTELMVPLDGSDASVRGVPVAGRLADRLGLGIRLLRVGEDDGWLRDIADKYLPGRDVAIETGLDGDPEQAIVNAAGSDRLICMGTSASLLPHHGHVGSVAEAVVRDLRRPVFLVGPKMEPHPGESTKRVVVPVDGSPLAEAALDIAGDLARGLGVGVWIVTNLSAKDEAAARSEMAGDFTAAESGALWYQARDLREKFGVDVQYEVLHGDDPAAAIVDFTGDDGTIVMTTHGRSGLSRLFGGSVATGVVAHSPRAVMVWRPDEEATG